MYSLYEATRTKGSGRTTTNLYLQLKWDLINYETHRYNVRTAKSHIDNKAPRTHSHLYYRPKKLQLEMERFCTIQRSNKNLMDRIATIQREGSGIDDKNFHEIKSLNTWKRQQQMIELAYNNRTILNRVLDIHAFYNRHKLEDEYMMFLKTKAQLQKFPKDWRDIKEQIKLMKKRVKEMIVALKKGEYKPELAKKIQQDALEREFYKLQKAEDTALAAAEAKEKEKLEKAERARKFREWKLAREARLEVSKKWREERDERLRLAKKRQDEQRKLAAEAIQLIEEKQKQKRQKEKETLQKWKEHKTLEETLRKEEEEKRKQEAKERERKRNIARRRKFQKLTSKRQDMIAKQSIPTKEPIQNVLTKQSIQDIPEEELQTLVQRILSEEESDARPDRSGSQADTSSKFDEEREARGSLASDLETSKDDETDSSFSESSRQTSNPAEENTYDFDSSDLLSETDKSSDGERAAKIGYQKDVVSTDEKRVGKADLKRSSKAQLEGEMKSKEGMPGAMKEPETTKAKPDEDSDESSKENEAKGTHVTSDSSKTSDDTNDNGSEKE